MTTMALTAQVMTTAAVVTDRPSRASGRATRRERSLNDAVRAYYALKLGMILGVVTVAMMAGAFIGQL